MKLKTLFSEDVFFGVIHSILSSFAWVFYSIYLFKISGGFIIPLTDYVINLITLWVGVILGSVFVDRVGYLNIFRLSMIMQALSAILIVVYFENILAVFILLAIIRGIGRGIYFSSHNLMLQKDLIGRSRSESISLITSISLVIGILMPIFSGLIIQSTGSYIYIFLITAVIYVISCIVPFSKVNTSKNTLSIRELISVTKRKYFNLIILDNFITVGSNHLLVALFTIIPFTFLKNELDVGLLSSAMSIIAAIFIFLNRKSFSEDMKITKFMAILYYLISFVLGIFWSTTMLLIREIVVSFSLNIFSTSYTTINMRNREKFLSDFKNQYSTELNIILETVNMFAGVFFIGIIILVYSYWPYYSEQITRIILLTVTSWPLFSLGIQKYTSRKLIK